MGTRLARHGLSRSAFAVVSILATVVLGGQAIAQRAGRRGLSQPVAHEGRNFDARQAGATRSGGAEGAAPAHDRQGQEIEALRLAMPDLDATFDPLTGATRTLWNRVGYLTNPDARAARAVADDYVTSHLDLLGLAGADVAERELVDLVYSRVTGATHVYYRQRVAGVPVYNGLLQVNVNRDGRIISVNNGFVPDLGSDRAVSLPAIGAGDAVRHAADHLGVPDADVRAGRPAAGLPGMRTRVEAANLSATVIDAALMWLPVRKGDVRLVWNFQIHTLDDEHAYDFTVDAASGQVWTRFDWVAADQYRVYPAPIESPTHAPAPPPADGRTTVIDPANLTASPFRWHDVDGAAGAEYTILRGNNVHAYADAEARNAPPAVQPDCGGSLDCAFSIDFTQHPSGYTAAAVANLFYWNNFVHDVQYQYGFDEAAGNFQVNNYARGGAGGDDVRAEAQDGGGVNNANFLTPPDGIRARMQMYLWDSTTPARDGDFDSGIIVHEYGHGISNRLVGGPSTVSCLSNAQQPGEGLSDWWALVYTAKATDTGLLPRGVGTYAIGQPATGPGIRGVPYSTDTAVNPWTYASIAGRGIPHGLGAVWAQGMWRVYWALVDHYGFSPDLYDAAGGAGNQRAMLYVNEGLKNTVCSPAFTDVRDGIIQAAVDNYGGVDVCRLWDAFAAFGLGVDAISGGPGGTTPTNGFQTPVACGGTAPSLSIDDVSVAEGASGTTAATLTVSLAQASENEVRVRYTTRDGTASSGAATPSSGSLRVPGIGTGSAAGSPASPYPSTLAVSGVSGVVRGLRVRLNSVSHTWPADMDVLLVGPAGQKVMLMSDAGGGIPVSGATLTFQDGAAPIGAAAMSTGVYAPTDFAPGEVLPGPAPPGPYSTTLSPFNGTNPNGTWRLYVTDDEGDDAGSIGSWSLILTTAGDDYLPAAGELLFPPGTTTRPLTVLVNGDTTSEPNETLSVTLFNPAGATIADAHGIVTIVDDDAPPAVATLRTPLRRMGLTPTYEWAAVANATQYQLWVDDPTGNRVRRWYTAAEAGCASAHTCAVTPAVVLTQGAVNWWVQTGNAFGSGPWSARGTFTAAIERFVFGLGSGGSGEFQAWSGRPPLRQSTLGLPWPAYNAARGELHPALGDLDGDGLDEIVVGVGTGGNGWLAVFDDAAHGYRLLTWVQLPWVAYNAANGATWPAVGDIDGDGRDEIVAGLGAGGQGFFAIFGDVAQGYAFQSWRRVNWSAYNATSSGETHPAVANIDGTGASEIVVGLGAGGGGWIEVVDDAGAGHAHIRWLRVGWSEYTAGAGPTYPAAGDVDADGRDEIVVGLGAGGRGYVQVFEDAADGMAHKTWLQVGWPAYNAAVGATYPAVGNLDGDAAMEILLGLGRFPGQGGYLQLRDDAGASYAPLGWGSAGRSDAYLSGAETFPAAGRLR